MAEPLTRIPPEADASPFDPLLDAFEEQVRAMLAVDETRAPALARLARLLPPPAVPEPPPTPERLLLADTLRALLLAEKRVHPRDQPQLRGVISRTRAVLGITPEAGVPPAGLAADGPVPIPAEPKPSPVPGADAEPVKRGAAAA